MWWGLCSILLASCIAVEWVRRVQLRRGHIDRPRAERWAREATPSSGGIGFVSCFLVAMLLLMKDTLLWTVVAGTLPMLLLGAWDDHQPLRASTKVAVQLLVALAVTSMGAVLPLTGVFVADQFITVFGLVLVTNAFNLSDNMDGLAAGLALIACVALALLFAATGRVQGAWVSLALAAAVLGFWFRNTPKAAIYMGDAGSLAVGMAVGVLAVQALVGATPTQAMFVPGLLFLAPLADVALVMVTRRLAGRSLLAGGTDHASHRLARAGLSGWGVLGVIYLVAAVAGLAAVVGMYLSDLALGALAVTIALTTAVALLGIVDLERAKTKVKQQWQR